MKQLEASRAIAQALRDGATPYQVAKAAGLSKTEVLNMADNANSRNYQELNTMKTSHTYESAILANSFLFEAQKAGRAYLKAKDAALKARGNQQAELIDNAKKARAVWSVISAWIPEDATNTLSDIVTEYCGLGREWNANGKMVKQFADANGIDQQLAADLVGRQMTVAQDYAQATRGIKFGRYLSWLEDAAADSEGDEPANLEEIILGAYNRAAQWNQPGDGLLIREFAENMGVSEILPTWADCLTKNMPTAEQAMEARKRISNRAQAAAAAEQEAEQDLIAAHGAF
jgi:hypothetical protein